MSEPPAIVPPGVSPKNAAPVKSGEAATRRLTAADLEGLDVQKIRCIGCLSYGSCSNKIFFMPEEGAPIFTCAQRKAAYAQEHGLDLPF